MIKYQENNEKLIGYHFDINEIIAHQMNHSLDNE